MNKPARKRIYPKQGPRVSLGGSHLLFEGHLETLDWHEHSFICVLMGVGGAIDVRWRGGQASADVILVPPSWQHHLAFRGQQMASVYYAPHQAEFARLCFVDEPRFEAWSSAWDESYGRWVESEEPGALLSQIEAAFAKAGPCPADARVRRLLRRFWRGEGLDEPMEALAAEAGLSASRLAHILKQFTGSPLRRLKRGYRFWHAACAMLEASTFTEVAHRSGFSDAAHFSRAFRNTYGLAPSGILLDATTWRYSSSLP